MDKTLRYVVWQTNTKTPARASVRTLLRAFPAVQVLQCEDPDYAVVLMDSSTEQKIRRLLPDLCIEKDLQYQMTS
jgi:hypothetical protein